MNSLFLETSAVLAAIFREPNGAKAQERINSAAGLTASRLIRVEAERALLWAARKHPQMEHRAPDHRLELLRLWSMTHFVEITREVCELAERIAPRSNLRSLDAIHLATFHRVRELAPNVQMLSFDKRILDAVGGA